MQLIKFKLYCAYDESNNFYSLIHIPQKYIIKIIVIRAVTLHSILVISCTLRRIKAVECKTEQINFYYTNHCYISYCTCLNKKKIASLSETKDFSRFHAVLHFAASIMSLVHLVSATTA